MILKLAPLFVVFVTLGIETTATKPNNTRTGKLFSIFQVVNFPNDGCVGSSSRNGTCYTSEECASKGGSSAGTCAQAFGVCCIFSLSCGGSTSENCTYLVQASTSTPTADPCTFTICKCSSNICRIRLDFTTFSIAGPTLGTTDFAPITNGASIGDCITDAFSLTAPGNQGSPVICGFNTGQHMIVDASDLCHQATFDFSGTATSRQFDIKVTQFACGDEMGGPDGCLQYFTGATGTFASFNFPTSGSVVTSTVTHLSNQCYTMCFRQEEGKCGICFNVVIAGTPGTITDQGSFGLSLSPDAAIGKGKQDNGCMFDYLMIHGAERDAGAAMFVLGTVPVILHERICGRIFGLGAAADDVGAAANDESICTQQTPFRVLFKTDEDEVVKTATDATANEQAIAPGGIIGFNLNYALQDC